MVNYKVFTIAFHVLAGFIFLGAAIGGRIGAIITVLAVASLLFIMVGFSRHA